MSNLSSIADMLRAYYPVIYINSFEYSRTIQEVYNQISSVNDQYKVYQWNGIEGLTCFPIANTNDKSLIEEKEDPAEVLKYIDSQTKEDQKSREVYILEDYHNYIEEEEVKLRLRKLAEQLRYAHKHIIIVSSVLTLVRITIGPMS